jgi:PAS domain S-box-containing protein
LYGAESLYLLPRLTIIAMQTATFILAVSLSIIVLHPNRQPMRLLTDPGGAGMLARRITPLLVIAAVVLGFVRVRLQVAGQVDTALGTALLVLLLLGMVVPALWVALGTLRRREEGLRNSEYQCRAAVAAGKLGMWEFDPATQELRWDARQYEIFGIDPSTRPNKGDLMARMPPEDAAEVERRLKAAISSGGEYEAEFRFVRPDGRTVWILGRGRMTGRPGAQVMTGVNKDITIYKEAERLLEQRLAARTEELTHAQAVIRRSERLAAMGTLAAGLGHDLANIILPMRLSVDATLRQELPDAVREDIGRIAEGFRYVQRLSAGLRQMTADPLSGPPHGGTDLTEWWLESEGILRGVLPRHIRLDGSIPPGLPPMKVGKPGLTQALFNLVQNAGEAMEKSPKGTVRISARSSGAVDGTAPAAVMLIVSDDGPGMTPEVAARCMEPYFSTKGRAVSTGMGLALVRSVVRGAGGSVEVESTHGEGTTFTINLPAWTDHEEGGGSRSGGAAEPLTAAVDLSVRRDGDLVRAMLPHLGVRVRDAQGVPDDGVALWITRRRPARELAEFIAGHGQGGQDTPRRVRAAVVFASHAPNDPGPDGAAHDDRVLYAGESPDAAMMRTCLTRAVAIVRSKAPRED